MGLRSRVQYSRTGVCYPLLCPAVLLRKIGFRSLNFRHEALVSHQVHIFLIIASRIKSNTYVILQIPEITGNPCISSLICMFFLFIFQKKFDKHLHINRLCCFLSHRKILSLREFLCCTRFFHKLSEGVYCSP